MTPFWAWFFAVLPNLSEVAFIRVDSCKTCPGAPWIRGPGCCLTSQEPTAKSRFSCTLESRKRRGSGDPSGLQNRRDLALLGLVSSTLTRFRHLLCSPQIREPRESLALLLPVQSFIAPHAFPAGTQLWASALPVGDKVSLIPEPQGAWQSSRAVPAPGRSPG